MPDEPLPTDDEAWMTVDTAACYLRRVRRLTPELFGAEEASLLSRLERLLERLSAARRHTGPEEAK